MKSTRANFEVVTALVKGMSGMPGFPFEPEARSELTLAFVQAFPSTVAIAAAITDILRHEERCPTVQAVWAIAQAKGHHLTAHERLTQLAAAQDCTRCHNTGYEIVSQTTSETVADICDCGWGQAKRAGNPKVELAEYRRLRDAGHTCDVCGGSGVVSKTKDVVVEAVKPCGCPMGQAIQGPK